ncbi:hypothetical protein IT882_15005 [Microbacterium schleiferi]|uniref:ATP-binding protein n=1 Tax=Microbacterium schleiferi TaxID=69362 RepID=A0A7S8RHJ9_9MICO|nr:hypothetical protein [Microbacterium schleiferi]QPE04431.1 hypothetical protein IT882_15005 [Microbacterium schleiferi]
MDSVLVARPHLLEILDIAPGRVVLTAPAGYGKTVLLDQWDLTREHETIRVRGADLAGPAMDRIRETLHPEASPRRQ